METSFFFKNMSAAEEEKIQDYVMRKIKRVEKMMSHFPQDGALLQVKGEWFKKHTAYKIELVLKIPSQTLTSTEDSHTITKAVDFAFDRLILQLKKNIQQHRGHRSVRTKSKATLREGTRV